jgi:hypothetical protein
MHTFILQDWLTTRGSNNTIIQSESEWLDLTQYQDLVVWLDVREFTGTTVTLNIQTAPTKDETFFSQGTMYTTTIAVGTAAPAKVLMSAATVPLARYVRWSLTSASAPFDVTFRIMISANAPGV